MLSFDVAATAGLYSQLAGVLAGFAFGALVVVLTSRSTAERSLMADGETARTLTSCFIGLILVSLTYAVLAGETTNAGRAAMVELVAAPGFIATGLLLILSIVTLLDATEKTAQSDRARQGATHIVRPVLAHVTPVILTASLFGGIDDYSDTRWGDHQFRTVDTVIVIAGVLVVLVPIAAYAPWPRQVPTWMWSPRQLSYTAVGIAAAASSGTYLVSATLDECQTLGQWFVSIAVAVPVLYMAALSTYLIKSQPTSGTAAASGVN
jgi:hypothetical protein